jgi:hypothetical protein
MGKLLEQITREAMLKGHDYFMEEIKKTTGPYNGPLIRALSLTLRDFWDNYAANYEQINKEVAEERRTYN